MKTYLGARNPSLLLFAYRAQKNGRSVVHGELTPLEHGLTLTHTQHLVMVGNTRNRKPNVYAEFVQLCTAQQPQSAH